MIHCECSCHLLALMPQKLEELAPDALCCSLFISSLRRVVCDIYRLTGLLQKKLLVCCLHKLTLLGYRLTIVSYISLTIEKTLLKASNHGSTYCVHVQQSTQIHKANSKTQPVPPGFNSFLLHTYKVKAFRAVSTQYRICLLKTTGHTDMIMMRS